MTLSPEPGYDLYAPSYKDDHPHLDSFDWDQARAWLRQTLEATATKPTLLDAGCGDGRTLARVARWELTSQLFGVDISRAMLARAAKRVAGAQFDRLDLTNVDACRRWVERRTRVNILTAFFVLVHFSRPEVFFDSLGSLVQPGGEVLMNSIPQREAPILKAGTRRFQIQAYHHDPDRIQDYGLAAGWQLVRRQDLVEDTQLVSTLFWWRIPTGTSPTATSL